MTSNSLDSSLTLVVRQTLSDNISLNYNIAPGLLGHKQLIKSRNSENRVGIGNKTNAIDK